MTPRAPRPDRIIDLLVLSDRYPPHSYGGAEISLHSVLREVAREQRVEVVSLCGARRGVRRYEHEGVQVTELPEQAPWPLHRLRAGLLTDILGHTAAGRPILRRMKRRALRDLGAFDAEELRALDDVAAGRARIAGGIAVDRQSFAEGFTRATLRRIVGRAEVRHLHADNFRAICVSDALRAETRTYLVRDNRFTCARHDQSRVVAGRLCGACDLACAAPDGKERAAVLAKLLALNGDYRRAQLLGGDEIVGTSRFLMETLGRAFPGAALSRVPNPADDADAVREATLGVPQDPGFNVLIVGMLTENKGQAQLLKAWARLMKDTPDLKLHFAGRGKRIEKRLRELAAEHGIADRVIVHGYLGRDDLYRAMARCQVVALPTMWAEPFGRVPLEAGLARRPVAAFEVGGLGELIEDGVTGCLVPHGDFAALAARVMALRADPALRVKMGEAAHRHVREGYAAPRMAGLMRGVWDRVRGAARRAGKAAAE